MDTDTPTPTEETAAPTATETALPADTPTAAPSPTPSQPPAASNIFYVSPDGLATNPGTIDAPWSLQHALNHPPEVQPGATIWVRGGTYTGAFTDKLKGSASQPIVVRAYPGERATLQNSGGAPVLDIASSYYVNFWGLEITSTYPVRSETRSESSYGIRVNQGTSSHHVNFINVVVHDMLAQGIGWWQALTDSEIHGSLFYYNGTTQLDHGVYFHNLTNIKRFTNNILNDNASYGFHGYAIREDQGLHYLIMQGNVSFNNGSIGYNTTNKTYGTYKRNYLVGGQIVAKNPIVEQNASYYPGSSGTSLHLGYTVGTLDAVVRNNYFMGGNMVVAGQHQGLVMSGNTIYAPGGTTAGNQTTYPDNAWLTAKPTGLKVFVRPNSYEPNRANLIIYNWGKSSTVAIDSQALAGVDLRAGDTYELRNAQDFYGDVITGVYDGSAIVIPMTGHSVAQPVGLSFKPASTFPEFGAFVLIVQK